MLTKLGPFQILEVIGRGGMGTVYRGIDPMIGRPVAVKVIRLVGYNNTEEQAWLKNRLFREARSAGSLCHPSIVTIYQVGEDQDVAYIAMEFVDGASLENILATAGAQDKTMLCRILCEAAAALDYAHKRGLVHRDIKPANIMLNSSGLTKVTDFGIAKTMLGQTATKTGMVLGTPFYMSPEQIRGKTLDGRSDQFALAVIAYEIFTGRKPFQAEQLTSICYQIIHEEPLSPEDVNPEVGSETAAVLKKGLCKDPSARFATCTDFAEALRAAATTASSKPETQVPQAVAISTPVSTRVRSTETAAAPRQRRLTLRTWIWAVTTLLAALTGIYMVVRKAPNDSQTASTRVHYSAVPARPSAPSSTSSFSKEKRVLVEPPQMTPTRGVSPKPRSRLVGGNAATEQNGELKGAVVDSSQPGAREGISVWTGTIAVDQPLTIVGARVSTGSLSGILPARFTTVEVYPAQTDEAGLTVFTSDSRYATPSSVSIPGGMATFVFDPRHATDVVVFELPSPQNNWERLVINVRNPKITACVIHWYSE